MAKPNSPKSNFSNSSFKKQPKDNLPLKNRPKQPNNNWLFWVALGFVFLILVSQNENVTTMSSTKKMSYSEFFGLLQTNKETGRIQQLELIESTENILTGTLNDGTEFRLNIPESDTGLLDLIRTNVSNFSVVPPQTFWTQMFFHFIS